MNVLAPKVATDQMLASHMDPAVGRWANFVGSVDEIISKLWPAPENQGTFEYAMCALVRLLLPKTSIEELFDHVSARTGDMHLSDVLHAVASFGLVSHEMPIKFGKIEPRLKSCLFVKNSSRLGNKAHPLVVLDIVDGENGREIVYYDAVSGTVEVANSKSKLFRTKGTAYFLRKQNAEGQATSTFQRKATKYSWFRALLTRFNKEFMCTAVLSLFANVLTLATPLFIMLVYDRVISVKALEVLPALIAGAIAGILSEWMIRSYRGRIIAWVAARIDWLVGTHIVDKLFSLPPVYAEKATVSSQVARIKAFEAVREFFAGSSFYSVIELPFVVIALAAIGFVAGPLMLVPLVMMVPFLVVFYIMRKKIAVAMRVAAKLGSMRQKFLIASLGHIEQIDASGLTDVWQKKHRSLTGREQIARVQLTWLSNVAESIAQALLSLSAVVTLTFGIFLVWDAAITAGGLVASMILVWRILAPLYSLCTSISRFEQIRNSIRQVNQLMDIEGEDVEHAGAQLKKINGKVEFDNVVIRYSLDSSPVVSGLRLDVEPGELVVIMGESGAGKTSLLKIAQGLYAPHAGSVRIDGFDIRQLDVRHLRRNIAYVPQVPDFFSGTILENMRLAKPDATEQEIWQAIGEFPIVTEIRSLPLQLGTPIGSIKSQVTLSALNMARALLKDTSLILIDKVPDSLLEGMPGASFKRILMRQHGKRAIMMISNRADVFDLADKVVLLRRGKRPVIGTPVEVSEYLHVHTKSAA